MVSCTGISWAPSSWTTPTESTRNNDYLEIYQYFSWNSTHRQALMDWLDVHGGHWQHEVRRHQSDYYSPLNVWDFLRGDWFSCVCWYGSNLPDPDPFWSEESNWPWQCSLEIDFDEEAEIVANNSRGIQANTSYYCIYRFYRLTRNQTVWCIWESEAFGSYPTSYAEYCDLWRGTWTS